MARSDDDDWDLASSVGATATMVAAGRARAARDGLIDDPLAEPLVRAVGIDFFTDWAAGALDAADVDLPDLPWGMGPMTTLMAARTRFIDTFLTEAVAAGITQVVVLASGLDARGYRLPWPAGVIVYEIDQPAVLQFKAATVAELGVEPTAPVRAVGIDLRAAWPAALRDAGFAPDRPTVWIAEGLLAFLPPSGQDRLLDDVTALSAGGSQLLTEMFLSSPQTRDAMRRVHQRWYERGLTVHLDDLAYPGQRHDVADYLGRRGWRTDRVDLAALLADAGLPVPADAEPGAQNHYTTAELPRR
ncbi:MAG TPA: class I SAM-dependent methyltransferase [Mycolicibacillus parakoreensis]|nr:class I SAM-dependent methyltransferase [Mycolicibacillus parakoreensis]